MEIYGIGNDIIEISRIKNIIIKNIKFINRVFTDNEINYAKTKKDIYATYSGRFSAKEAFYKAMGTGILTYGFNDIEILNDRNGKPYLNIVNLNLKKYIDEEKLYIHLTISHSKENAIATVLITKKRS